MEQLKCSPCSFLIPDKAEGFLILIQFYNVENCLEVLTKSISGKHILKHSRLSTTSSGVCCWLATAVIVVPFTHITQCRTCACYTLSLSLHKSIWIRFSAGAAAQEFNLCEECLLESYCRCPARSNQTAKRTLLVLQSSTK